MQITEQDLGAEPMHGFGEQSPQKRKVDLIIGLVNVLHVTVNSGNLDSFRHRVIRIAILPPKKLV